MIRASDASYDSKIASLDSDYAEAANQASARAQIDLKNTLEKMADGGYYGSGETVQATIAANADRAKTLSALARQNAQDKREYESEKEKARAGLSLEGEKEAMNLQSDLTEAIRDQENRDREYEAQKQQNAFENSLKSESLKLQKQEAARSAAKAASESSKGIEPEKDPYTYVDDVVARYSKYEKDKGYTVVNKTAILKALSAIIKDTALSYRYRYEMYIYGKSLGYLT